MKLTEVTPQDLPDGREAALEQFKALPLPMNTEQRWRYTRIDRIDLDGKAYDAAPVVELSLTKLDGSLFLSDKVVLSETTFNGATDDKLAAMHAAFLHKAFTIAVSGDETFRITLKTAGKSAGIQINIKVEDGCSARILFEESSTVSLGTTGVSMDLGEDAKLHYSTVQTNTLGGLLFSQKVATLGKGSSLDGVEGFFPKGIIRSNTQLHFSGDGSHGHIKSVFIGKEQEQVMILNELFHTGKHTDGDIKNRGIIDDKAYSVFQGRIIIDKVARDTSSYLDDKTLTFSSKATANTIPSLEIDNNDVQASHGSTIGMIDEEQLFYMMSRGVSKEEAQKLIIQGFLGEMLEGIPDKETIKRFDDSFAALIGD